MMRDLGIAFRTTRIGDAMRFLGIPAENKPFDDLGEAVDEAAAVHGLRARRVLLDAGWWKSSGGAMLARVADRRHAVRPGDAPPEETGWIALVPRFLGGYRAWATSEDGQPVEWKVDGALAERLAPFAFTFYRTFERKPISANDLMMLSLGVDLRDVAIVLGLGIAAALVGLLTPLATSRLIDHAIPSGNSSLILLVVAGLALAGLSLTVFEVLRSLAVLRVEGKTGIATQAAILDRLISAPSRFFRSYSSGDLAQRLAGVGTVQRSITAAFVSILIAGLFVSANLGLMWKISASLTAAALTVVAATIALSVGVGLARVRLGRRIEALDGRIGSLSFEYLSGIAKLRAGAAEARAFGNWTRDYRERREVNRKSAMLANFESVVLGFLQPAAIVLVLLVTWQLLTKPGAGVSTGGFVAFNAAMFALLGGVRSMVSTSLDLMHLKPLWERARPILEALPEGGAQPRRRHDPKGAIRLERVSFAYPEGDDVLHGIDLDIRPGEFVALVGPSGSGKSTLIRLLLGFELPREGRVLYDGEDLATLSLAHLRRRVGTVLQGGRLWAGDLHTNIVGAASLSVDAAWEAARAAGLAEDIEAMPMGMYTMVSEGLSTLSGGQRQRVLIARALVAKPAILLLDEATSALDNVSQGTVLGALAGLEATRLLIAHRLSAVRDADRIVVLDAGRIVQEGTFPQLAAKPGLFAELLARQT
jgi:NHLM bacteriocin system ABC transporter ATP-binding protein